MAFVDAYDTRTGKKLPHLVPEHWIKHPVLGRHLSQTPRAKKRRDNPVPTPSATPAVGDDKKETPNAEDAR